MATFSQPPSRPPGLSRWTVLGTSFGNKKIARLVERGGGDQRFLPKNPSFALRASEVMLRLVRELGSMNRFLTRSCLSEVRGGRLHECVRYAACSGLRHP